VTNARPLMRYGAMHEWSCVCQATTVARFISGVDEATTSLHFWISDQFFSRCDQ